MIEAPVPTLDDEIDLREIILTLWKARVVIIMITILTAALAFVVSNWFLPDKYNATVFVLVKASEISFIDGNNIAPNSSEIKILPLVPDIKTVVGLATSPGLLESVTQGLVTENVIGNDENLAGKVSALEVGKDQISLSVVDTDAQLAAQLANAWAEKVVATVNSTYGISVFERNLNSQVNQAGQDLAEAQAALEEALAISQTDALEAKLQRQQADLGCVLEKRSQLFRVAGDLETFEQGLKDLPEDTLLLVGDGLVLTNLQQGSLTSQLCQSQGLLETSLDSGPVSSTSNLTIQIDSAAFAGLTVSKAKSAASNLRSTLQTQITRLEKEQDRLEREIPGGKRELENAQAQLAQFIQKKEQSQAIYDNLLKLQQRMTTVLKQSLKVAQISMEGQPPQRPMSRNVERNTAAAGLAGLMLVVLLVFLQKWWQNNKN